MARFLDLAGCGVRGERSNFQQLLVLLGTDSIRAQQDTSEIDRPQPCPYTRTLYANQLRDPRVAEVLRGKHVLPGAQIRGIPDLVASPVQGLLPGVYWHAMALDNLLVQDSGYWRSAPDSLGNVSLTDLIELVLVLVAGVVALLLPETPSKDSHWTIRCLSHYLFWFLVLCFGALGASLVLAYQFHIAPLDWLGLILAIGLFYAYLGEPRVAAWWARLIAQDIPKEGEAGCSKPQP
ncbi:hypothetical protein D9M68_656530 [compost metagenome]